MKVLRVGDPHAKVSNLDEMKNLILFVAQMAKEHKIQRIEILGDLMHTHAVLRLEVVAFWIWALDELRQVCQTVAIYGNHDVNGDYNFNTSSLHVFKLMNKENLIIIEEPTLLGVIGYVPYHHDMPSFTNAAGRLSSEGAKVLVCHQTIQGSKYDNGMYAPDGIPTGEWSEKFTHVISGHIHAEQSFGNIIYPGTARWDTIADANSRKGVWIYEHDDTNGQIINSTFLSTENVCSPIKCIEWKEGEPQPEPWNENARVAVELIGSSAWIAQEKTKLKGKCTIKTKIVDKQKPKERSTGSNLEHFISNLFSSTMDRKELLAYAKEIGIV